MLGLIVLLLIFALFVSVINRATWGAFPGGLLGVALLVLLLLWATGSLR